MKTMTRDELKERLHACLVDMVDEENSICKIVAERGIFCQGLRRCSEEELREKFAWISRDNMTREQFEDLVNAYMLGRSASLDQPLACDAQELDRDTCLGWDEFTDRDLERFSEQLLGERIRVAPAKSNAAEV